MLSLKIPPVVIFMLAALAMFLLAGSVLHITKFSIVLAVIIWLAAVWVGAGAVRSFKHKQTTINPMQLDHVSALVTTGIFKHSRNPMYLSLAMLLIGWGVLLAQYEPWLMLIFFVAYMTQFQIKPEEAVLKRKFGDDYLRYCQQVRRWL